MKTKSSFRSVTHLFKKKSYSHSLLLREEMLGLLWISVVVTHFHSGFCGLSAPPPHPSSLDTFFPEER